VERDQGPSVGLGANTFRICTKEVEYPANGQTIRMLNVAIVEGGKDSIYRRQEHWIPLNQSSAYALKILLHSYAMPLSHNIHLTSQK
jgi:hypothetical protein